MKCDVSVIQLLDRTAIILTSVDGFRRESRLWIDWKLQLGNWIGPIASLGSEAEGKRRETHVGEKHSERISGDDGMKRMVGCGRGCAGQERDDEGRAAWNKDKGSKKGVEGERTKERSAIERDDRSRPVERL